MRLMPDKIDELNLCLEAEKVKDAVEFCYKREFDSETGLKMIAKARGSLARIEAAILRRTEKAE